MRWITEFRLRTQNIAFLKGDWACDPLERTPHSARVHFPKEQRGYYELGAQYGSSLLCFGLHPSRSDLITSA